MRIPLTLNNSYKIVVKRLSGETLATLPGGNQQPLRNLMETAVALSSTVRHGHKDLEGIAQISWNAVRSVFSKYKQVLLKQMSEGNRTLDSEKNRQLIVYLFCQEHPQDYMSLDALQQAAESFYQAAYYTVQSLGKILPDEE